MSGIEAIFPVKMKNPIKASVIVLVLLLVVFAAVFSTSFYMVDETEQAVIGSILINPECVTVERRGAFFSAFVISTDTPSRRILVRPRSFSAFREQATIPRRGTQKRLPCSCRMQIRIQATSGICLRRVLSEDACPPQERQCSACA